MPRPLTERAEELVRTYSSADLATSELVTAAGGRRAELEEARDLLVDRLHRASDDYAATNALRLVYRAIDVVDVENVTEPVPLQPARHWSRRRRAGRRRDARARDRDVRIAGRAAAVARATEQPEPPVQFPTPAVEGTPGRAESDPWAFDRAADDGWPVARVSPDTTTDDLVHVGAPSGSR